MYYWPLQNICCISDHHKISDVLLTITKYLLYFWPLQNNFCISEHVSILIILIFISHYKIFVVFLTMLEFYIYFLFNCLGLESRVHRVWRHGKDWWRPLSEAVEIRGAFGPLCGIHPFRGLCLQLQWWRGSGEYTCLIISRLLFDSKKQWVGDWKMIQIRGDGRWVMKIQNLGGGGVLGI